jgi:hypothetical protein
MEVHNWLTDWLTLWLILTVSLTVWLSDWLADWLSEWLTVLLSDCLSVWLWMTYSDWLTVFLEKFRITRSRNSSPYMELECSIACSQEPLPSEVEFYLKIFRPKFYVYFGKWTDNPPFYAFTLFKLLEQRSHTKKCLFSGGCSVWNVVLISGHFKKFVQIMTTEIYGSVSCNRSMKCKGTRNIIFCSWKFSTGSTFIEFRTRALFLVFKALLLVSIGQRLAAMQIFLDC